MTNIQHTKLETHDGKHGEQEVDFSVMLEFFYSGLQMTLKCRIPNFGPFLDASQCLFPEEQSQ
jgi:hypothetical protein